jgi:hypothetical protein
MTFVRIHKPHVAYRVRGNPFGIGAQNPVRIILHDTESGNLQNPSLDDIHAVVMGWHNTRFGDGTHPAAQFIVDGHGQVGQTASAAVETQHVGGLNGGSIGIEQVGFASLTHDEWLARKAQLERVARLMAWFHHRYGIPLHIADPQGASEPNVGVLTHAMVSKFEPASEGHTDPGPNYPLAHVLARAVVIVSNGGWHRGSL